MHFSFSVCNTPRRRLFQYIFLVCQYPALQRRLHMRNHHRWYIFLALSTYSVADNLFTLLDWGIHIISVY